MSEAPSAGPEKETDKDAERGSAIRADLAIVADWVRPGARVLDIGCGDGALLAYLTRTKAVDGRGIEISQAGVNACVRHGLSVVQGDADADLRDYPSDAFDFVILSQTLQATREPRRVLAEMLRIGRCAIVSFPNFAHWRARLQLLVQGRMPVTRTLDHAWYDTPNIHLCSIRDFTALCDDLGARVSRVVALNDDGRPLPLSGRGALANLLAAQAVFLLCQEKNQGRERGDGAAPLVNAR